MMGWASDCAEAEVRELDKNLTSLAVAELHDYLAKEELIPERGRAGL